MLSSKARIPQHEISYSSDETAWKIPTSGNIGQKWGTQFLLGFCLNLCCRNSGYTHRQLG